MFLEDILEQLNGDNNYFLWKYSWRRSKDRNYEVIDGQQRLTTLTIFMRALLNTLDNRKQDEILQDFDFEAKEKFI